MLTMKTALRAAVTFTAHPKRGQFSIQGRWVTTMQTRFSFWGDSESATRKW